MLFLATGSRSACKHGRLGRLFAFSSATCCGSQFLSRALQTLSRAILRVNANLNAGEKCDYEGDEFLFLSFCSFFALFLFFFFPFFPFFFSFFFSEIITLHIGRAKVKGIYLYSREYLFILVRIYLYPWLFIYLFIYTHGQFIKRAVFK